MITSSNATDDSGHAGPGGGGWRRWGGEGKEGASFLAGEPNS